MDNIEWKSTIEFTNLKSPHSKEIKTMVEKANAEKYYGVCLLPGDLGVANKYRSPELKLITVAGFPPISAYSLILNNPRKFALALGYYRRENIEKIKEITNEGLADELDIIFPLFWYFKGYLLRITKFLTNIKKEYKRPLKVIIELGTIFRDEKMLWEISNILQDSGVDYLKSNSGLIKQDYRELLKHTREIINITKLPTKISGGIRYESEVIELLSLGVKRIGTSGIADIGATKYV
jgi:deoxyribose-phosphate aldolase